MQILVMLFFLLVWLLVLWIGSILLESTGLERYRARFQALSALSGTGFTTSHAEDVIEHPQRRRIISYLIFLGNAGILAFIVVLVVNVREGLTFPSTFSIIITVTTFLVIGLAIWLGLVDWITSIIMKMAGRKDGKKGITISKILYQHDDFALIKLTYARPPIISGTEFAIDDFNKKDINVIAIERDQQLLMHPEPSQFIQGGDNLICAGKLAVINSITGLRT